MPSPSSRAFSSGNSFSASAHALSTVGTRSFRSMPLKSASSTQVTGGTSRCARVMCSAIRRRTPRSGSRRPSEPARACPPTWPPGARPVRSRGPAARSRRANRGRRRAPAPAAGRAASRGRAIRATSRGLSPRHGLFGRLRLWRSDCRTVLADDDEHRADRDDLALFHEDARHLSGGRRRDLDRRLVGLDLDERLVLGDLVPTDTSQRATSPSVRPSPRSGSLNSYATATEFIAGRPTQASAGTMRTRSPPSTRQSETACSSPVSCGAISRGT